MTDLIARLKSAPEGSRDFDADIAVVFSPWLADCHPDLKRGAGHWLVPEGHRMNFNEPPGQACVYAEQFSTSLDAALTLVPEGLYGKIGFAPNRANARIWLSTKPAVNASIQVPQPALALCIAALKAREATR